MEPTPRLLVIEPETTMVGSSQLNASVSYQAAPTPHYSSSSAMSFKTPSGNNLPMNSNLGNRFPQPTFSTLFDMIPRPYKLNQQIPHAMVSVPNTFHNYNTNCMSPPMRPTNRERQTPSSTSQSTSVSNVSSTSTSKPTSNLIPLPVSLHRNITAGTLQEIINKSVNTAHTLQNVSNNNSTGCSSADLSKQSQKSKARKTPPPANRKNVPWDAHLRAVTQTGNSSPNSQKHQEQQTESSKQATPQCNEIFIDHKKIPFVYRDTEKNGRNVKLCLLPVAALEQELLSNYPKDPPDAIKNRPALEFYMATSEEKEQIRTRILLESDACRLVEFNAFMQFFELLKKCIKFDKRQTTQKTKIKPKPMEISPGWVQLDNSIVPYIRRETGLHVPKCVIEFVCKGRPETLPPGSPCSEEEAIALNKACRYAGISINFAAGLTLLVQLDFIVGFGLYMKFLPKENPIRHAQFLASKEKGGNGSIVPIECMTANTQQPGATHSVSRKRLSPEPSSSETKCDSDVSGQSKRHKSTCSQIAEAANPPVIETNEFKGKSLACLKRGNNSLVLLEAIVRVFFSFQSIRYIGDLLVGKQGYQLVICSKEEERAFIKFYGIPTDKLQNNTLVDITVLSKHFDYLSQSVSASKTKEKDKLPSSLTAKAKHHISDDDVIVLD